MFYFLKKERMQKLVIQKTLCTIYRLLIVTE